MDQIRRDAMSTVEGLSYLTGKADTLRAINRSIEPALIRNLVRVAVEEDAEKAAIYWECVGGVPELLPGAWSASGQVATPLDGQARSGQMYVLALLPSQDAALTVEGSGWWLSDEDQTDLEAWFEANVDEVSGWASDLDQVIDRQDYRASSPPGAISRNGCTAYFTMTLTSGDTDRRFDARLVRSGGERYLVLDDAIQFDPYE